MKENKTLVCFTASYPYGNKETYFENELQYLSQQFEKVIIIPTYNAYGDEKRSVPINVEIYPVTLKQGKNRFFDFFNNLNIPNHLISEININKIFNNKSKIKSWLLSLISYGKGLNNFLSYNFDPDTTILYSYWSGQNFFIDKKLKNFTKVVRMHGGDFYLERNNNYIPLQFEIYKNADLLLPISKDIYSRLVNYYNIDKKNIRLSYLGVKSDFKLCTIKTSKVLKVISCSNVYALKRIDLIYQILLEFDPTIEIEWSHIGSGELLISLKEYIQSNYRENIKVNFLGQKSQDEIKKIYESNYYDFFINTSEYEGLPVSVMEAHSYGIPAVATNVGGTSEIVNNKNGLLIDKYFNNKEVAKRMEEMYVEGLHNYRKNAYETWQENFNAEKNYGNVIKSIKEI
ncbi:glycosyltransferase [Empedobacter falsenii]